ncbi:alpha/beta hydrolase [Blastomonas fulva]|jgi:acetyl esterase/lipase|uniref:alpha/beta hydrolase n=1 Tax=Blastomonas fulva TaxID=1550728 RepID=UPI003D2DE947
MRWQVNRRQMLLASGVLLMNVPALDAREALQIPQGTGPLPPEWTTAPSIALWDGPPPGAPALASVKSATLDPVFITGVARPEMRVFRPEKSNGRAVLTIPGGAYNFVSIRNEGTDVARVLTALGYTVFVLVYRLPGEGWAERWNVPLQDAQRAMRIIRARAQSYAIDPATVAVLGFSAGGHLAASLITASEDQVYAPRDAADRLDARPMCAGLIYPVIAASAPHTHDLSAETLLGPSPGADRIALRSPAFHVDAATPPTFLVHALDDTAVPYPNSTLFMDAMLAAGRPVETHYFEEGGHGFGIGPANAPAGQWPALFDAFLRRHAG